MKKYISNVGFAILICLSYPLDCPGRELTILFTHDLHSYFLPPKEEMPGGYAKLATLINRYRLREGGNCLLLDAGDFSMGTLFHTSFSKESSELILMAEMGYDAITLGNHDFDFRPDGLAEALKVAQARLSHPPAIIASNLSFGPPDSRDQKLRQMVEEYPVKKYLILNRDGIRIGIFGLLGHDARDDAPFARPVKFTDPIETAKEIVKTLKGKEKADIIICLSHSGTSPNKSRSEDELLARAVPEIDVIISGHTHTILTKPLQQGKTIIGSAGCYGEYLGVIKLKIDAKNEATLKEYRLIPVTADVPDYPPLAKKINYFKKIVERSYLALYGVRYDDVVAEIAFNTETLPQAYSLKGETSLGNLITDAFRFAIKHAEGKYYEPVHLVIQPLGLIRSSLFKGLITNSDVFRVLSLGLGPDGLPGYPLLTAYLSGEEIKQLMEVETTISRLKRDAHLQISGAKLTYNPNRTPFDRVLSVNIIEEGVDRTLLPNRLYRVAMNYYCAQMVDYITRVSYGLLKMEPKDREGKRVTKIEERIVKTYTPHGERELKEWLALASYLKSFPDGNGNGIPDVPSRYRTPEGRIIALPSWHPWDLIRGGNFITWGALSFLVTALFFLGLAVWFAVKKAKILITKGKWS